MVRKILNLIILVPLALVLVVLCVANRHFVTLALNPFRTDDQLLSATAPFFVFLLLSFLLGAVIGGVAVWFAQGKHRKAARREKRAAVKWENEAENQRRRVEQLSAAPVSPAVSLPKVATH